MAHAVSPAGSVARAREQSSGKEPASDTGVPWYLWCGVLSSTLIEIGGIWDYSWHRSIGRDTFWTPAHMAIQSGGLIAAGICAYLLILTTFGGSETAKASAVRVFGLRAPLGAFLAAWGGLTMVTSVPFDNWWHAAYGLDVKIVSPPHALLIFGVHCVAFGILLLILSSLHRAVEAGSPAVKAMERLYLYAGGVIVMSQMFLIIQYLGNGSLHLSRPYRVMGAVVPVIFALLSQAHPSKWAATAAASIYTAYYIAAILILPLFPAQPKLGPVFYPVTHMVPSNFPMLLIAPAIVLDLLYRRMRDEKPWILALVTGVVFTGVLVAFEWPFADFLMSRWAENRFFGTMYYDFSAHPSDLAHVFASPPDTGLQLAAGLVKAAAISSISALAGIYSGRWMRGVRR
jgi:hypothetical protein